MTGRCEARRSTRRRGNLDESLERMIWRIVTKFAELPRSTAAELRRWPARADRRSLPARAAGLHRRRPERGGRARGEHRAAAARLFAQTRPRTGRGRPPCPCPWTDSSGPRAATPSGPVKSCRSSAAGALLLTRRPSRAGGSAPQPGSPRRRSRSGAPSRRPGGSRRARPARLAGSPGPARPGTHGGHSHVWDRRVGREARPGRARQSTRKTPTPGARPRRAASPIGPAPTLLPRSSVATT